MPWLGHGPVLRHPVLHLGGDFGNCTYVEASWVLQKNTGCQRKTSGIYGNFWGPQTNLYIIVSN